MTGMGSARGLWEKLAVPEANVFARFEDALHVPIDWLLPSDATAAIPLVIQGPGTLARLALQGPDWGFPVSTLLDSGRARIGVRVASDEPHILELGALGIPAFFATPLVLHEVAAQRQARLGPVRRVLVQVNGPLAPGVDATDVAFAVARDAGVEALAGSVLEYRGEGVEGLTIPARRRLCAASLLTGCTSAFTPIDERLIGWTPPGTSEPFGSGPDLQRFQSDPEATFEEILVVNGDELRPLAARPDRGVVQPVADIRSMAVQNVVHGGCHGGDLESLTELAALLARQPVAEGVLFFVVPGSRATLEAAASLGLDRELAEQGARLVAPQDLPPRFDGTTMAGCSCLAPGAVLASPPTLVSSAHAGRAVEPGGAA